MMDFTKRENYDEELVDYILDEFITFQMVSDNLYHQDNNYSIIVCRKSDDINYFITMNHKMTTIYEYSTKNNSYRFAELNKELKRLFGDLDKSAKENELVRDFLGTKREKKIEKIIGNIEDDNK